MKTNIFNRDKKVLLNTYRIEDRDNKVRFIRRKYKSKNAQPYVTMPS